MIVNLEKEYNYKEAHFDYIQQYIRRICLQCEFISYLDSHYFHRWSRTYLYFSQKRQKLRCYIKIYQTCIVWFGIYNETSTP